MSVDGPKFRVVPDERPRSRSDRRRGLTEQSVFPDTGCELSPTCLSCTQARCKYDDPDWSKRLDLKERDNRIVKLRDGGLTVKQVAAKVGVSERTAYRVLLEKKRGTAKSAAAGSVEPGGPADGGALMSLEELAEWRPVNRHEAGDEEMLRLAS